MFALRYDVREDFEPVALVSSDPLLIVARKVWRGDFDEERPGFFTSRKGRYENVEIMGLYWHFVDLVWVFIFALFYLW